MDVLQLLAADAPAGGGMWMNVLPIVVIIGIFWFLVFRPERQKQKKRQEMINSISKNDKVVTIGGIHGIVKSISDTEVQLMVDEKHDIVLKFNRSAIYAKVGGQDQQGELPAQQ